MLPMLILAAGNFPPPPCGERTLRTYFVSSFIIAPSYPASADNLMNTSMKLTQRVILILAIALSCIGLDQGTKAVAKANLSLTATHSLLGDTVRLQLAHNTGAFLGLGDSFPASRLRPCSVGLEGWKGRGCWLGCTGFLAGNWLGE